MLLFPFKKEKNEYLFAVMELCDIKRTEIKKLDKWNKSN